MSDMKWPYPNEMDQEEQVSGDVLVLGGGMAGCYAAIAAARKGKKVVLVEKGATIQQWDCPLHRMSGGLAQA